MSGNGFTYDVFGICKAAACSLHYADSAFLRALNAYEPETAQRITQQQLDSIRKTNSPRSMVPTGPVINTLAAIKTLGGNPGLFCQLASDPASSLVQNELAERKIPLFSSLDRSDAAITDGALLIDGNKDQRLLYRPSTLSKLTVETILPILDVLKESRIVLLGLPFRYPETLPAIDAIKDKAVNSQLAITLQGLKPDPDSAEFWRMILATGESSIILGNKKEFSALASMLRIDTEGLVSTYSNNNILAITCDSQGAEVFWQGVRIFAPACIAPSIVSRTGAGDSWAAGFLWGIARDYSIGEAARLGNRCASRILGEISGLAPAHWENEVVSIGYSKLKER